MSVVGGSTGQSLRGGAEDRAQAPAGTPITPEERAELDRVIGSDGRGAYRLGEMVWCHAREYFTLKAEQEKNLDAYEEMERKEAEEEEET